ncbi:hypothetical protein H4R34_004589 [Dimargaris verticillata]|uniref:Uncharacterized protein n=1 Tax=Dimargaris verticillata TaxID=2761393 RepID=A0A9W8B407_9FUNG|nr:hypothetical protein H4R34_004589 [Dimargaris verticillata]
MHERKRSETMSYYPNTSYYGGGGGGGLRGDMGGYGGYGGGYGSHASYGRGLGYYPGQHEYYNGTMFPDASYHNRGWSVGDYAHRWLGPSHNRGYGRSYFDNIYSGLGSPSSWGSQWSLAHNPMTYRSYHNQLYYPPSPGAGMMGGGSAMVPYGGGGHAHGSMHRLGLEGLAAAAAFQAMKMWENRRMQHGFEPGHMGGRDMVVGSAMAEAIRMQQMGGYGNMHDPYNMASQAAMRAQLLYDDHLRQLRGGMAGGYVNPYY